MHCNVYFRFAKSLWNLYLNMIGYRIQDRIGENFTFIFLWRIVHPASNLILLLSTFRIAAQYYTRFLKGFWTLPSWPLLMNYLKNVIPFIVAKWLLLDSVKWQIWTLIAYHWKARLLGKDHWCNPEWFYIALLETLVVLYGNYLFRFHQVLSCLQLEILPWLISCHV